MSTAPLPPSEATGVVPAPALPTADELLRDAHVVAVPLVTRFRGILQREALVTRGPAGWTEFSPFLEYDDAESSAWLAATVAFGWGEPTPVLRDSIRVNATMPAVDAEAVPGVLSRFPGCRTVKIKVAEPGDTLDAEVARVRAVREALGPEGRIRIDANGLWNVDEAEHAIHALERFDLEYVEQPCASIDELSDLRRRVRYLGLPIAADESVRKAADPLAVARAGAADILVLKAQPLGGADAALRIVALAGLPAVVSSAIDTSIGIAMGAHLAAALPSLDHDCGLGTVGLLGDDVVAEPLRAVDGAIPVRRPEADPDALARLAVAPERRDRWFERLRRCLDVLTDQRR